MLKDLEIHESNLEKQYDLLCKTNGWNILFQRIKNGASLKMMNNECNASRSTENRCKNKYREIVPYDYNRIILPKSPFVNSDYINASMVIIGNRSYIVTQYPYKTCLLFWLMIWEYKSPGIVMLGKFDELEMECYFPKIQTELKIVSTEGTKDIFSIRSLESNTYNGFVVRKLLIRELETNLFHELWHFEFWSWPDQMTPKSMNSFLTFMGIIRESGILDSPERPPTIHCSAGAGRSGTFCLIDLILVKIEQSGDLDNIYISELVENLRIQRMGMVHSVAQLKFCFEAIIEAFKRLKNHEQTLNSKSYLMCNENEPVYDNELLYYSSSDSVSSDTICIRSSDEEIDNEYSYDYHSNEYYEDNSREIAMELNTNNVMECIGDDSVKDNEWSLGKLNLSRREILNRRKTKNKENIDSLSKHLHENHLKRYRFLSTITSSSTISLLEEINDNYYWSMMVVGGAICFMGACLWLKYNPFK